MTTNKTLLDLEWPRLLAAVRARSVAPGAAERPIALAESAAGARTALAETGEALGLLAADEPLPLRGIRDVRPGLERVAREGVLDGPGLRDLALTLEAATGLGRFLGRRRERLPALHAACAIDPTLERLTDEISFAIEADGTVSSQASPELRRLRTEVHNLRARLVSRLEEMIHKNAAILSDTFYTTRDGRYVLPVRSDAHERFPGIVHGTSASGATLFVEPRGVVTQGNRLKVAQAEMEREETRILALLSDLVRERHGSAAAALDALEHADLRNAMALLGQELDGLILPITDEARVHLLAARHPLLILDGVAVVPNDVSLDPATALVVSGPNAGGKTVALKVVGLAALMARAGMPIPAAPGSTIGYFDPILTDVGDEQSIEKNLSTFSAHVRNIGEILAAAGPRAMILLDELAGGTDPAEGAALACAVVEALVGRGALVAVTTHYEQLKAFALTEPSLRNASVGFDVDKLLPTFELVADVPGASSALSVASRFGIGPDVIDRAREILPAHARGFDDLTRELGDARARYEAEARGLEEERRALGEQTARAERRTRELEERDQKGLGEEAAKLRDELRGARDEVRRVRKEMRRRTREGDTGAIEVARREIEAVATATEGARQNAEVSVVDEDTTPPISIDSLTPGTKVYVPRLRTTAEVTEVTKGGGVKILAGAIRLTVRVDELRSAPVLASKESKQAPKAAARTAPSKSSSSPALSSSANTVDVRGLRVDEALSMAETFVDRLYGASEPHAFIIHGHGTGALRDAIRAHFGRDSTYARALRAGTREEGGDGVTVVSLR
ncbi:MAG: endonuclease MutS2 [Deltaproteobacteria bacterium]|nr:MAG: endonuclease MutS2 [Deltaproteobacteria bacterium]